jgi:pyruvate dehydrogenase E2 component (dihydrolipoamide acetyltransferase)
MATPVEAPKLGNTVEEVLIARWAKRKGDPVSAGDLVAEIETDKATFEVTAPVNGTLLETFFAEGALVPVFTNLFVIGDAGENVEAFRPGAVGATSSAGMPGTDVGPATLPASPLPSGLSSEPGKKSPPGSGLAGRAAGPTSTTAPFSPRARRFAEEHDFHPSIAGSGPGGRVLEEDVRKAYYTSPKASGAAKKQMQAGLVAASEGSGMAGMILSSDLGPAAAPISNLRGKIARRMRESLAATAQYTLNASADAGGLLTLRARIKASKGLPDININDLVTFCTIKALLDMPELNVEFIDGKLHKHAEVHIGFAVDTARGLLVAVVRNAHAMQIGELAAAMKDLTKQAAAGTISADSLSGATFTISNLGGLGIESFTPLLNPPQVAILGVGAIGLKPVRKQGRVEFIDAIGLSLTCDHQIIDGAPGARFLKVVREKIENVESLCTI